MKGVILAGGFGKRMLESTRVINKHLLPVYSEHQGATPMIFYPLNTLISSGITEILIITSDEAAGLVVETVGNGSKFHSNVDITYKIQNMHDPHNPIGIASALKISKNFTNNEKFAVILGDNFFSESFTYDFDQFYNGSYQAHVFLKDVHDPHRFGVAVIDKNKDIVDIEEKPRTPKSSLAVSGLYLYTPHVYSIIDGLKESGRGELEVSDVNKWYATNKGLSYTNIRGFWRDMGIPTSMMETMEYINKNIYRHEFFLGRNK